MATHCPADVLRSECCHTYLNAPACLAEHCDTPRCPDRLVIGHPKPQLTDDLADRRRNPSVRFGDVIGIHMGDMRPVDPNRLKHESHVVESTPDLRLEG